jgi:hypothetical protein
MATNTPAIAIKEAGFLVQSVVTNRNLKFRVFMTNIAANLEIDGFLYSYNLVIMQHERNQNQQLE